MIEFSKEQQQWIDSNYMLLPKDINGVPIHVGDKVCTKLGSTYTVARITREDYQGMTTWYIEDFASHHSLGPEDLTICKPPTVEDVLREFTDAILEWAGESGTVAEVGTWSDVADDFVKRLQLREED